ncbi:pilus assembly protein TadG-related protein [Sinomonas soli]
MRRLTLPSPRTVRGTAAHDAGRDGERGAVAVLTALLLVVLLAVGALAVDGGMLYAEHAQLQNGADSAALGVAQRCALNPADTACTSTSPLATGLTQQNAAGGQAGIASLAVDTSARSVTAQTQPLQPGSQPGSVALYFARALGIDSAAVGARAKAVWGSPSAGPAVFPITFSVCQVQGFVDGGFQRLQSHSTNINPGCNYGPSGSVVPGGFGWLTQDPGQCGATINIATAQTEPGNSAPANCDALLQGWAASIQAGNPPTALLPVFTQVTGTGNNVVFTLSAFAAFSVQGWKFSGNDSLPSTFNNTSSAVPSSLWCTGSCRGIIGKFITYVSLSNAYQLGAPTSFGATVVRLAP